MLAFASNRLGLVAGLLGFLLCQPMSLTPAQADSLQGPSRNAAAGKRWATFDFAGAETAGDIQIGKPLELTIALAGVGQGHVPLVAICESIHFQRQVVTLEPDSLSMMLKATAILEPMPVGKLSMNPKVARIQVTFARAQKEKLERVMTRIVYVTLGKQESASDANEPLLSGGEDVREEEAGQDEVQPDANPIATGLMVEEDLLPLPTPDQGQAYWQQISYLLSRSWSRNARRVRHAPSGETVRVRFRLYPSGRAQLIQIEKGSGAREVDEAGIYTIVQAQPFPPLPADMGSEPVDVHVRMRTGVKTTSPESRSVANPQAPTPKSATISPKK